MSGSPRDPDNKMATFQSLPSESNALHQSSTLLYQTSKHVLKQPFPQTVDLIS